MVLSVRFRAIPGIKLKDNRLKVANGPKISIMLIRNLGWPQKTL